MPDLHGFDAHHVRVFLLVGVHCQFREEPLIVAVNIIAALLVIGGFVYTNTNQSYGAAAIFGGAVLSFLFFLAIFTPNHGTICLSALGWWPWAGFIA